MLHFLATFNLLINVFIALADRFLDGVDGIVPVELHLCATPTRVSDDSDVNNRLY